MKRDLCTVATFSLALALGQTARAAESAGVSDSASAAEPATEAEPAAVPEAKPAPVAAEEPSAASEPAQDDPPDADAGGGLKFGAGTDTEPSAESEGSSNADAPELVARQSDEEKAAAAAEADANAEADARQAKIDRKRRKAIPWIRRWRPERNMVTFGLFGGVFIANQDHDLYDPRTRPQEPLWAISPDIGARVAYYPLRVLGIEGEFSANPTRVRSITNDFAFVFGVRAHAILQLPFHSVTPFFLAGGGVMGVRSNILILGDDTDPAAHYGGGVKIHINRYVGVRLEGRNIMSAAEARQDSGVGHIQILGGVTFTFNRKKPRPPVPPRAVEDPDRDNDGILNEPDECPDAAGVEPHGCPDTDGDGFRDSEDECPEVPGIAPKGCPDKDTDGDGIMDSVDQCIYEKEVFNGIEDEDGCPDELPPELVQFEGALEGIEFDFGKDTIRKTSQPVLDKAVATLKEWPSIKIMVSGHTDNFGKPESNLELSKRRAAAVKTYMVAAGLADDRIETEGKGDTDPRADNETEEGRALNRRIEFHITDKGEKLIRRLPDGSVEVVGEKPKDGAEPAKAEEPAAAEE